VAREEHPLFKLRTAETWEKTNKTLINPASRISDRIRPNFTFTDFSQVTLVMSRF